MQPIRTRSLLGLAVALALAGGLAAAQTPAPKARVAAAPATKVRVADPATEAQLAAAQKDLEQAARRVAALNRQLGRDNGRVQVIDQRMVLKPVIGVVLAPDAQGGVRVAGVTPDSGAAKAGLKTGDRITSVNGTQVLGTTSELRVDNARTLLSDMEEGKPVRIGYQRGGQTATASVVPRMEPETVVLRGAEPGEGRRIHLIDVPGMAPGLEQEIIRIGPRGDCKGQDCKVPMLAEAFRWNGLNLASVDPALGRYFGTDRGVLVLSAGADLAGLQPGDVIQKIDGRAVSSPRDAMDALRDKPENAMALVEYLRDRKVASTRVKVPKAMPFRVPAPPPPPPPRAPKAPLPPPPPPAAMEDLHLEHGTIALYRDGTRVAYAPDAPGQIVIDHVIAPTSLPAPPEPPMAPDAPGAPDVEIITEDVRGN
ncbi:hypothetical protein LYSHEL_17880 [Lysobacter helvus]|uniref:PDZ domain-containing protein n=2 Tax=Lysobacteraceae TaxID=32033 RepID=A0ABN6FST4_9GAMM|nr:MULTISPECIES: PDZ domain-containing protein [Lysobacter]BCT92764.1 hypothetical protein LYSCAS_17880 [Lysobacter caseinilyticus]BCT95917.1 hypothetical protein LYSHEL_17880 [Lysobacter helvus]